MSSYLKSSCLPGFDIQMAAVVEATPTEEHTTHPASCHCGAVAYTVTLKYPFPKYTVLACNCSICEKNGYLLVYPTRKDVVFVKGEDNLSEYRFNSKTIAHKFCKSCGSSLFIDIERAKKGETDPAKDIIACNVRMFTDVDLEALQYTFADGKRLIPRMDG